MARDAAPRATVRRCRLRVIQWSTGNVGTARPALHHPPSRPRAGRPVGAQRRQGRDGRRRAVRPRRPTGVLATNDVDALLALDADCVCYTATADLRPWEAVDDIVPHPRVGQERGVELGRAAAVPAARARPGDGRAARSRVPEGGTLVLHLGHRSRVRQRPAADRADGRRASTSTRCASMEIVELRHLHAARGAVRHDGLRQAARLHAAAVVPGRAVVRVGRRGRR